MWACPVAQLDRALLSLRSGSRFESGRRLWGALLSASSWHWTDWMPAQKEPDIVLGRLLRPVAGVIPPALHGRSATHPLPCLPAARRVLQDGVIR